MTIITFSRGAAAGVNNPGPQLVRSWPPQLQLLVSSHEQSRSPVSAPSQLLPGIQQVQSILKELQTFSHGFIYTLL